MSRTPAELAAAALADPTEAAGLRQSAAELAELIQNMRRALQQARELRASIVAGLELARRNSR